MPTALVIGAGPNIGQATAEAFANAGYAVAVASRSSKLGPKFKHFPFDATKPETVRDLFNQVEAALGHPSVVVYNAYSDHITKPDTPFEGPLATFMADMAINTTSAFAAAHAATDAFAALHNSNDLGHQGGTFIFTGNMLNDTVGPGFMPFGMGKAAAAHMIQHLALVAYKGQPFKFYYPDQRLEDGTPMYTGLNGAAHAKLYVELAADPAQREWQQTFVADQGYKKFERIEAAPPL